MAFQPCIRIDNVRADLFLLNLQFGIVPVNRIPDLLHVLRDQADVVLVLLDTCRMVQQRLLVANKPPCPLTVAYIYQRALVVVPVEHARVRPCGSRQVVPGFRLVRLDPEIALGHLVCQRRIRIRHEHPCLGADLVIDVVVVCDGSPGSPGTAVLLPADLGDRRSFL